MAKQTLSTTSSLFLMLVACQFVATSSFALFSSSLPHRDQAFYFEPAVRTFEDNTSYKLIATFPGVAASGVSLNVTDHGSLKLVATDTTGSEVFRKSLRLADDANLTSTTSWCADGILEITIDKLTPPEPVTVIVQAAEPPALDSDSKAPYVVRKVIPGLNAEEVSVTVEHDLKSGSYFLNINASSSKGYGEYVYSNNLPEDSDTSAITAFCLNGLLHIHVPPRAALTPTTIQVLENITKVSDADSESPSQLVDLVKFSVPGYTAKDIRVEATPGCGKRNSYLRMEFEHETTDRDGVSKRVVERYVALPDNLEDFSSLEAVCVDGMFHVRFPESALRVAEEMEVPVSAEKPVSLAASAQNDSDGPQPKLLRQNAFNRRMNAGLWPAHLGPSRVIRNIFDDAFFW